MNINNDSLDNLSASDWTQIFTDHLVSTNENAWAWMPRILLARLNYNNIPEKEQANIMRGLYMNWVTYSLKV